MENRTEKALALHKKGYNCAQSVACAYCDLLGIDEKTAFAAAEGFGAGMGGMREACGAATAMFLLAGLKNSSGELTKPSTKAGTYKIVKEMAARFEEKNTTLTCQVLKGLTGGPMLRSCDGCIEDACNIVEEVLLKPCLSCTGEGANAL